MLQVAAHGYIAVEGYTPKDVVKKAKTPRAPKAESAEPKKRGRKKDEEAAEIAQLRHENERLRKQLEQAAFIIAAQKKLAQALERLTNQRDERS